VVEIRWRRLSCTDGAPLLRQTTALSVETRLSFDFNTAAQTGDEAAVWVLVEPGSLTDEVSGGPS